MGVVGLSPIIPHACTLNDKLSFHSKKCIHVAITMHMETLQMGFSLIRGTDEGHCIVAEMSVSNFLKYLFGWCTS